MWEGRRSGINNTARGEERSNKSKSPGKIQVNKCSETMKKIRKKMKKNEMDETTRKVMKAVIVVIL